MVLLLLLPTDVEGIKSERADIIKREEEEEGRGGEILTG